MKIKDSMGIKIFRIVNTIILTLLVLVTLYPIVHVVMASFSDGNELMAHRGVLLTPLKPNLNAYKMILADGKIFKYYWNTIYICAITLVFNILLTSFAAYFLTRKEAIGKKPLMMLIMFTMYFNGGLIPTYLVIQQLGILNTVWSLILPVAISTYNMIVLRTSFAAVPESLYESARMEGAGHFRILFQIMLPLTKASLAVVVLYYLVSQWNSWFQASIYITDNDSIKPLQLYLTEKLIENDTTSVAGEMIVDSQKQSVSETLKYAMIVVATVPVLCVYPFLQKYFAKGVMIGAVKG